MDELGTNKSTIVEIVEQVRVIIEAAKETMLPLLKKAAWHGIENIYKNAGQIFTLVSEIGKIIVVAEKSVIGEDGKLDYADVDKIIDEVVIMINAIIDIPIIPELIEGKVYHTAIHAAYKAANKIFKSLPSEFTAYKAIIEKDLPEVVA